MKKYLSLFTFLLALGAIHAQGIAFFSGTFEEAKALAKKENKVIFMDAYAEWCGPCKRMAKDVFPTKEAGDYFNANFVNVKMDMEKGEGRDLAQQYRVNSYPTLLFLDYTGKVIYETKGARRNAEELINLAKQAVKPNENALAQLEKKWNDGNRTLPFLQEFIIAKATANKDYEENLAAFLSEAPDSVKQNESTRSFIFKYTKNIQSAGVAELLKNKKAYVAQLSAEAFDKKINTIVISAANAAANNKDQNQLAEAKKLLATAKPKNYKEQSLWLDMTYYETTEDWNNYDKSANNYISKYKKNDSDAIKKVAWNYYMNIDDAKKLSKAEQWIKKAVSLDNSYDNNLTDAYLLYKLKRYSEAQDAVEYALILSKEAKQKTINAEILKKKIEEALNGEKKEVIIDYDLN